nr:hypothetical protein [Tanacetum cinerariifolium]
MNSYTFMGLDDVEEGEEISSRKKSFMKRALAYIKIRRQENRVTRNIITRDRAGAHKHFVATFFTDASMYDATRFSKTFRMTRPLFNQIVNAVTNHGMYPELAPLVKTIPEAPDDDHKRILYKQKRESARKYVKRAFGVLKKKWAIRANLTRALKN